MKGVSAMKKFCKFILGTLSIAAVAGGAYLLIKKLVCKDCSDSDAYGDDSDYFSSEETDSEDSSDGREYVSINITTEPAEPEAAESDSEASEPEKPESDPAEKESQDSEEKPE